MKAVILAAGLGTRMGDLTKTTPKPLLKLQFREISPLEHNLHSLPEEIDEVIIVVGYLKEQIKEMIGDHHAGKKITYVEQKELKGTGHALWVCREHLQGRFLVFMGDDIYKKEDFERMLKHNLAILAWELKADKENDYAAPIEMDEQGKVLGIVERQKAKKGMLINAGAYVIDDRIFDYEMVPAGNKTDEVGLPQTFIQMTDVDGGIDIVKATEWYNVTIPEDLEV